MGETSRNKEILENKFLIERFLLKLLEAHKISQNQVQDLKWLFRKELLSHEHRTPKERLQILVAVFREWKNKKDMVLAPISSTTTSENTSNLQTKNLQPENVVSDKASSCPPDQEPPFRDVKDNTEFPLVNASKEVVTETTIPTESKPSISESLELNTSQISETQTLKNLVDQLIADDLELAGNHSTAVAAILLDEVQHVAGTGMNISVVKRYLVNVLERYKREHNLKYKAQELSVPVKATVVDNEPSPQHVVEPVLQQNLSSAPDTVQATPSSDVSTEIVPQEVMVPKNSPFKPKPLEQTQTQTVSEIAATVAPIAPELGEVQTVDQSERREQKEKVVEIPEDSIVPEKITEPQKVDELPKVNIASEDSEPIFKTKVTSGEGGTHTSRGKSLASIILQQAREADQKNPLSSHQEEIPIPEKVKQIPKKEVDVSKVKIIEEEGVDLQKFAKPQPKTDIPEEEIKRGGLGVASNTFVSFDKDVELDGDQIGKRHEVRSQQKKLFEKYVEEQLDTVLQVISNHRVYDTLTLATIREDLTKDAMRIADKDELSISDKIHELDTLFTEKRDDYVKNHVVDPHTPLEEMVDVVMARAGQEVRTKDPEADARFRETLRDTLHFKAKHLLGVGTEKNAIQAALDEEYIKHKTFYFKTSV